MATKMKTRASAAKRFKVTGGGRIKFKHSKMRHILAKKASKMKRRLRRPGVLNATNSRNLRVLVPYK
ncbi:MAG: 50S ribosomal protein L35 [Deltaproteobacteria bacterium]|nr:50S ribosomal protein L35 [Deltaproteobacteria bacterium]